MRSRHFDEARFILKECECFGVLWGVVYRMYPYEAGIVSDLCLVEERAVPSVVSCDICRVMRNPSRSTQRFWNNWRSKLVSVLMIFRGSLQRTREHHIWQEKREHHQNLWIWIIWFIWTLEMREQRCVIHTVLLFRWSERSQVLWLCEWCIEVICRHGLVVKQIEDTLTKLLRCEWMLTDWFIASLHHWRHMILLKELDHYNWN